MQCDPVIKYELDEEDHLPGDDPLMWCYPGIEKEDTFRIHLMSLQCLTKLATLIVFFQYCPKSDVDPLVVKLIRPQPHIRSAVRNEMDTDEFNWELSLLLEESSYIT